MHLGFPLTSTARPLACNDACPDPAMRAPLRNEEITVLPQLPTISEAFAASVPFTLPRATEFRPRSRSLNHTVHERTLRGRSGLRVCPKTLGWIAEFSEHEPN